MNGDQGAGSNKKPDDAPPPHYHVFVCYASEDHEQVKELANKLSGQGVRVAWDEGAQLGRHGERAPASPDQSEADQDAKLREQLAALISHADYGLIVWGNSARASDWCSWEVQEAGTQEKPLLLVRLGNATPVDPHAVQAVEVKRRELTAILLGRKEPPKQPYWDTKAAPPRAPCKARRYALYDLLVQPHTWWRSWGAADGNAPLLAPQHIFRQQPTSRRYLLATLLEAGVLAALLLATGLAVVPTSATHVLVSMTATTLGAGVMLAFTVGTGAGVAAGLYGVLAGTVAIATASLLRLTDTLANGATNALALIATIVGVTWWRLQLGLPWRSGFPKEWSALGKGFGYGLLVSLWIGGSYLLVSDKGPLPPFKSISSLTKAFRAAPAVVGLAILLIWLIRGAVRMLNRARNGPSGSWAPIVSVLGFVAATVILRLLPVGGRYPTIVAEGVLLGVLIAAAFAVPAAKFGVRISADRSSFAGLGAILGVLPSMAMFIVLTMRGQASEILIAVVASPLLAVLPLWLLHRRTGRFAGGA